MFTKLMASRKKGNGVWISVGLTLSDTFREEHPAISTDSDTCILRNYPAQRPCTCTVSSAHDGNQHAPAHALINESPALVLALVPLADFRRPDHTPHTLPTPPL